MLGRDLRILLNKKSRINESKFSTEVIKCVSSIAYMMCKHL